MEAAGTMAVSAQQAGVKRQRSEGDDHGESSVVPADASAPFGVVAGTDQHDGAGGSGSTGIGAVAVPAADQGDLDAPLAFVDRYAEALDVLMPNLANHERLRRGTDAKLKTPLAGQPPGTGKTVLGRNVPAILRRPREQSGSAEEAAVAERLRTAWCWEGAGALPVDEALKDARPENLVVRTLLAAYPYHEDTIMKLKNSEPLIIEMKALVTPDFGFSFDKALAYSIFCLARGLRGTRPATKAAFLAQDSTLQSAAGMVEQLLDERRGLSMMLVLDDITDLADPDFASYFNGIPRASMLHRAMAKLSLTLQLLHAIPRCFVFCTGRSLWLSSKALVQATSPMILRPTLLQPLTEADIAETLRHTTDLSGHPLLESLGVAPEAQDHLIARAQRLTGGVGRAVQFLLRARHRERSGGASLLRTSRDVDCSLERLVARLPASAGVVLSIDWALAQEASETGAVATWLNEQVAQAKLLQLFARMLLLDAAFEPAAKIAVGSDELHLSDAAVVFGLSYGPAATPVDDEGAVATAASGAAAIPSSRTHLRLIAGEFLCRSLLTASSVKARPATLSSVQLLATMRCFGGTMRGRPFEMLCADALCFLALLRAGQPLGTLLPHLNRTGRNEDRLPVVREEGYALRVVALPKAAAIARPLDDEAKAVIMRSRERWTGAAVIHTGDLPWLLSDWLLPGCLGVPADAQSGSQDFFLRLSGGVIGFALKAASASAGTDWGSLREELSKAPALPAGIPYTLVLWSLHLAAQLKDALGSIDSAVYDQGKWLFQIADKKLVKLGHGDPTAACTFEVATGTELVIANPHAPSGGGLAELLGASVLGQLQAMGSGTGRLSIAHLTEWMAKICMAADGNAR